MAARGRGSAHAVPVLLLLLPLACLPAAYGAVHTVGGTQGWDLGVDYTAWTAGKTFKVGDVLFFRYTQTVHNVVVVNKAGYDACSDTNAITTLSAGNDNVTLTSAGTHYYLCSVVGHCSGGMKLVVTVSAATAAAPTPTATAPVPAATTPAPAPTVAAPTPESLASAPTPIITPPVSGPAAKPPASSPMAPGLPPTSIVGTPPPPPPDAAPSLSVAATFTLLSLVLASMLSL
ncbi:hypothetical protein L7F22_004996 [Adiantum nelumboides]|nr:hypothetical protein [Adiantum nelumboides]